MSENPYESPREPIIVAELVRKKRHPLVASLILLAYIPFLCGLWILLDASRDGTSDVDAFLLIVGMAFILPAIACVNEIWQYIHGT